MLSRTRLRAVLFSAAMVLGAAVLPAKAQEPAWNDIAKSIAVIDWRDPLNLRYVNLGDDRFLFDTREGVKLWDFATRQFVEPRLEGAAGVLRIAGLSYRPQRWARLGGLEGPVSQPAPGTAFIAETVDRNIVSADLLWWNPRSQSVAAGLSLGVGSHRQLLQVSASTVLVCQNGMRASVAELVQRADGAVLRWATPGDPKVKAALEATGVVGSVQGFGSLALTDAEGTRRPVFYDASTCAWELKHPPPELAPHLHLRTRSQETDIHPYFLADGRVLVPEIRYWDAGTGHWHEIRSALLWTPGARMWARLSANRGSGNLQHRVGLGEPVFAASSTSDVIEFFDPATLTWKRSTERLPYPFHVSVEPLRSGQALVLLQDSDRFFGRVFVMGAAEAGAPAGRLLHTRDGYYGEVALPDGRMLLLGGGLPWAPIDAVELVDMAANRATAVRPLPALPIPMRPIGLPLRDGSVLVYAGMHPSCSPADVRRSGSGPCIDHVGLPSLRYWPQADRWEVLPQLKIPYSCGPHWQAGNSDLSSQWPRVDVTVRPDGRVVWVHGAEFPSTPDREDWPRTSQLLAWSPARPDAPPVALAKLRKGRIASSLITLDDGRLAVMGGDAQLDLVALEKDCLDCPDEFVSIGPFRPAHSTEVLDETNPARPVWRAGPLANFGGGKAFKLANGRIFKLSLAEGSDERVQAEVADAAFIAWTRLPAPPTAQVNNVGVIGNRVLLLTSSGFALVWDDDKRMWLQWRGWPALSGKDAALSIMASPQPGHAFVRYRESFATLPMPRD